MGLARRRFDDVTCLETVGPLSRHIRNGDTVFGKEWRRRSNRKHCRHFCFFDGIKWVAVIIGVLNENLFTNSLQPTVLTAGVDLSLRDSD